MSGFFPRSASINYRFFSSEHPDPFSRISVSCRPVKYTHCVLSPFYSRPVSVLIAHVCYPKFCNNGGPQHPSSVAAHLVFSPYFLLIPIFNPGWKDVSVFRSFLSTLPLHLCSLLSSTFQRWGSQTSRFQSQLLASQNSRLNILCF